MHSFAPARQVVRLDGPSDFDAAICTVAPGLVATPLTKKSIGEVALEERGRMIPFGRLAEPRQIAYSVARLAGSEVAMMMMMGRTVSPNRVASIVGI